MGFYAKSRITDKDGNMLGYAYADAPGPRGSREDQEIAQFEADVLAREFAQAVHIPALREALETAAVRFEQIAVGVSRNAVDPAVGAKEARAALALLETEE